MMGASDLLAVRTRWQRTRVGPRADVLRIGLLASYTIDPVVPYLGVALDDAGLPASLTIGPFNQIVRECLAPDSAMARLRPDLLVVAPRLEELSPEPAGYSRDLLDVVEVATAAARRWRAVLVLVLPAVPEDRVCGVLDQTMPGSVPVAAEQARHAARAALAGRRNCYVVDAEQAVRAVGTGRAHHGGMFRFAKIPYTEPVFAALGELLAGVVRAVHGASPRAAVLDGDWFTGAAASEVAAEVLAGQLRLLHRAGARLGLVAREVGRLATMLPEFTGQLLAGWVLGDQPAAERLDELATVLGVSTGELVVLTGEDGEHGAWDGPCVRIRLPRDPDSWPDAIRRGGLLDRLPAGLPTVTPEPIAAGRAGPAAPTLADFVAGLQVEVTCEPVHADTAGTAGTAGTADTADKVAEVVSRAKDFTLGTFELPQPGTDRELLAVRVADRLGRYGISGAASLRYQAGECVVDVFSLSCPVLGKGVQDAVLREIVVRARAAGAHRVRVPYRLTGHNQVAVDFLAAAEAAAGAGVEAGAGGPELIVEAIR